MCKNLTCLVPCVILNFNEVWKVAREITNPRKSNDWSLKTDEGIIYEPEKIANTYFVEKIVSLKNNIDMKFVKDRLTKLEDKMKKHNDQETLSIKQLLHKNVHA